MTTQTTSRGDRAINVLATFGVGALTALSYVLSYAALHELAFDKGEPSWAAVLWPACLDVAALVAGLAAIGARRRGRADHYAEALALLFSIGVLAGNVALAGGDPVAVAVHGTPAVTMLCSWHLLWRMRATSGLVDVKRDVPTDIDQDPLPAVQPADVSAPMSATRPQTVGTRPPAGDHVRRLLRTDPDISAGEVARRCAVTVRHARRLLAAERSRGLVVLPEADQA